MKKVCTSRTIFRGPDVHGISYTILIIKALSRSTCTSEFKNTSIRKTRSVFRECPYKAYSLHYPLDQSDIQSAHPPPLSACIPDYPIHTQPSPHSTPSVLVLNTHTRLPSNNIICHSAPNAGFITTLHSSLPPPRLSQKHQRKWF